LVAQTGLIVLLVGVVAGQNLERLWHRLVPPACAVEPANPLAVGPAVEPASPAAVAPVVQPVRGLESSRPGTPTVPARREPEVVARPLTESDRWITTPSHDATRRGYSVWTSLRPGGNLIVERCRAPDWTAPSAVLPTPSCEVVLDQVISAIDATRIELRNGRSFPYSLGRRDGLELLQLSIAEELELVPGSKTTLVKHLSGLAGDAPARARWARLSSGHNLARN